MTLNRNLLSKAVRYGLAVGAVGMISLAASPAFAQDTATPATTTDKPATTELDKITVTGSRIRQVEQEGPNPVTIIKREDLEVSGQLSIADVLRSTTFNSFGSFQQTSGSSAQSQSTVSLRGLGSQYTLVLLDGRRIAGSPVLGAASQNLNSIPFGAVERIEILRGGASAIYGSDAIGGVINIILRTDYEGLQVSVEAEQSTYGEPFGAAASITGGVSSDRGNLTFVIDHQQRDIFFNRQRPGPPGADPGVGLSVFGFPGSAYVYDSTDGSFDGNFLGSFADPRCPSALGSDPLFPNSVIGDTPYGTLCYFNYAATNANEASLNRDSLLVSGNFDITDNISAFTRVIANKGSSFGRYAPTPITNPFPTISGDNPNNPFGGDALLLLRFVSGGTRDDTVYDHMFDTLFGFRGYSEWFGGSNWEVAAHHNKTEVDSYGRGYLLRTALQPLIDSGAYNPFGDPNTPANLAAIRQARASISKRSSTSLLGLDGNIAFDLFDIGDRPVGFVMGFDVRGDKFSDVVDAQSAAGNISGTAGGSAQGSRDANAIYMEARFPILANFNVGIAARYDHYSDFGTSTNPQVSLEFRPLDNLLLRGSWGTGFRAPDLSSLYAGQLQSFNNAIDRRACDIRNGLDPADPLVFAAPINPCNRRQYENVSGGNPDLKAEESTNWSAGVVWNPMEKLSLGFDWYNIKLEDQIGTLGLQTILDLENQNNGSPFVTRNPNGSISIIQANNQNIAGVETSGWDFEGSYSFDTAMGTFGQALTFSHVVSFDQDSLGTGEFGSLLGLLFLPQDRAQLVLDWRKGDWTAAVVGNAIGETEDKEDQYDGKHIGVWATWDVQASWKTPWKGKVTAGVRNIGNKSPPLFPEYGNPYYNSSLYNYLGRVPYVKYEQNF